VFIGRNAEGVHTYLLKCYRGTFSSVGMLKGYIANERLGTTGVDCGTTALNVHRSNGKPRPFVVMYVSWLSSTVDCSQTSTLH